MKFLAFFSLALVVASVSCFDFPKGEITSVNIQVPVKRKVIKSEQKKLPYQVGILLKDSDSELSWCGGSLISNEWVLTAAHCIEGVEEATVYLGSSQRQSAQVKHKVKKQNFIIHPNWDSENLKNDISLIRIPFTHYNKKIKSVKLPALKEANPIYKADDVITSGWGHISDSSAGLSNALDWSFMHVIENDLCRGYFGWVISPSNICVSSFGALSTCRGDTGGPLVLESSMTQIGVSSFGSRKGCEKGIPSVFTRVSFYLDWIQKTTGVASK